jgi:protein required for attachment to host cells
MLHLDLDRAQPITLLKKKFVMEAIIMKSSWILVANNSSAHLLTAENAASSLEKIESFVHTENRLHDREITTDLPGKIRSEGGSSGHALEQPTDPKKHESDNFAHQIAHYLEDALNLNKFEQLLIVAEPSFLGLLRNHLTEPVKKRVCFELDKNIVMESPEEIRKHLPKYFPKL